MTAMKENKIYMKILEDVRRQVQAGTLKSGDRLPGERQMAARMHVSRSSVREAMRALEMIGLLECREGSGTTVSTTFDHTLTQPLSLMFWLSGCDESKIHELRMPLEIEAASLAAKNGTPDEAKALLACCDRIESEEEEAVRSGLDGAFHRKISEMAKNPLISGILSAAGDLMAEDIRISRREILAEEGENTGIDFCHREVAEAIKAGDEERARRAMEKHLSVMEKIRQRAKGKASQEGKSAL